MTAVAIGLAAEAHAQSGGAYDLSWNVIGSGGGASNGGVYTLSGTAGQPDAAAHAGGAYNLLSGFWAFDGLSVTAVGGPRESGTPSASLAFRLHPSAPNPFRRETTIAFDLPQSAPARVGVYNVSGALVRTLLDGSLAAGPHAVSWEGRDDRGVDVAQGVYVLRLESGSNVATRKVVLTR